MMRIGLANSNLNPNLKEIDLKRFSLEAKLANMYLDPSGQHLLLAFSPKDSKNPAELLYLGPQSTGPKDVPKIKSHSITAVAWNQPIDTTTATSTAPFLLGTSKGLIFEAEISNGDVKSCKQVFDIGKGNPVVISGLEYFYQPSSNKCYILVATAKRLYQFKGFIQSRDEGPCFSNVFTDYLSIKSVEEYLEFGSQTQSLSPQSDLAVRLHILYEPNSAFPRAIGYVPEIGPMVYINVGTNGFIDDSFLKNVVRIPYPKEDEEEQFSSAHSDSIKSPKSLVLTEYHTLLLFKTAVKGLCLLDEELIFTDAFGDSDKILNIVRDPIRGSIWSFTEKKVGKYAVTDEDRNIWKIYLEKGEFDKARTYSNNDEEKLEQISMKQADSYFDHKEYEISAMYYAMTKASFEEIALKFVKIDDSSALKTFLKKKLSSLRSHEPTKVAVLVIWLIEIYLNELGALRDFGKHDTSDYNNLESEFLEFMKHSMVEDCVRKNKKAVYDLMASHGDKENLIHFTLIMKDYDEVIENNIAHGQYEAALTTLHRQKDAGLYHRFIPILLDKDPKATIDILISSGRMLNPSKLLPKFSSKLDESTAKHITRYLEHCVNSLRISEQPIHDYLVSLYVYFYTPEKLMEYLQMQGNEVNRVNYDPKHALMLCLEKNLYNAAIHLYTLMGLYEEAVGLAIQIDLELAKKTANVPQDDVEIKKKLWLKIAKHVVKEKNDIQQAMEFLQQCDLLKIEDILPFFPNFVTIDHFKDAICSSLQEYNLHIQNLKEEMEEATKSAEVIREEIQSVRNRCTVVRATDQCTLCNVPLLIRNFYVFPCGHQFHADCLLEEVYPTLSQPRKALLSDYQKKISELTVNHDVLSTGSAVISARDQIKSDIDDIVASECIYCGEIMIKLIDSPFIPEEEWDHVQKEWE